MNGPIEYAANGRGGIADLASLLPFNDDPIPLGTEARSKWMVKAILSGGYKAHLLEQRDRRFVAKVRDLADAHERRAAAAENRQRRLQLEAKRHPPGGPG